MAIIQGLRHWTSPSHQLIELSENAAWVYHLQEELGWNSFLEGFHHRAWEEKQQQHFKKIRSLKSALI
jgi:hypothetical protein